MKKLIVGLGNPGDKYKNTRHNIGFMFLDKIAEDQGLAWVFDKKFNALICEYISSNGDKYYLAKPQTYMNLSGSSVKKLVDYYDITLENLLVIHDEIDLEFGTTKMQKSRGDAGHNGVKDISNYLGSKDYWRLRVGIGRPAHSSEEVSDFVLGKFNSDKLLDSFTLEF